jgi:hypothetical protein
MRSVWLEAALEQLCLPFPHIDALFSLLNFTQMRRYHVRFSDVIW